MQSVSFYNFVKSGTIKAPRNKYADHAVNFISNLTLVGDYSGLPFKLIPEHEVIIRKIFGTRDKQGRLQYRKVLLYIPRKNSKTTLATAILLYSLLGLGRKGQQILSCAADREQAAIVYRTAEQMIEQDEYLQQFVELVPSQKRIVVPQTHSFYVSLSGEHKGKLGYSPSVVIFDELEEQPNRNLWTKVTSAFGGRTDYLLIAIMTAGDNKESVAWEELDYAQKVQAGIIDDPRYLPILYHANEEDDWADEKVWEKCNPLWTEEKLEFLRSEYKQAKEIPARKATFCQYYLNLWQNKSSALIADEDWQKNNDPPLKLPTTEYVAGLDFASVEDTTCLCLFGKNPDDTYDVIPFFWVSEERAKERTTADFNYPLWVQQGYLKTIPGQITDPEQVLPDILKITEEYKIKLIGADRWGLQNWLGPRLIEHGIPVVGIAQNYSQMSEPLKTMLRLALAGKLRTGGNPVLRWHVSNAKVLKDNNENYRIVKTTSVEKVDGIVALNMAVVVSETPDQIAKPSIYETQGITWIS